MRCDRGPAHNGFADWLWQRASALALVLLLPVPVVLVGGVYAGLLSQAEAQAWLARLPVRVVHTMLLIVLAVHAYIGLKVIAQDYVHRPGWRLGLLGVMLLGIAALVLGGMALIWDWGR